MDGKKSSDRSGLLAALLISVSSVSAARGAEPETPLGEAGQGLQARYAHRLAALRAQIIESVPSIDEKESAAFLKAHAAEAAAKSAEDAIAALARAQTDTLAAARPILAHVEGFLASDGLDARLIPCAILANATPRGLAEFAQRGKDEEALVERLLADGELMERMLVAGGAKDGKYGEAMLVYTRIRQASARAGEGILRRLALGTSLEQAVPVGEFDRKTSVDPVKRYLNYEKAFLDGELDPAFEDMSTWECRFITNADAPDEQILWGREMLRNYRPDLIFDADYRWRYSRIVKTDVAYKNPEWTATPRTYQQLINGGGKCGPRAWFGRFILRCFGIPTWGVRQRGHAALSHWTPDGWTVNFGAHWRWNWWEDRGGEDFLLETQAREHRKEYMKVLRAQWVGDALGEPKVDGMRPGTGGLWNALALNQKRAIVADAKPIEVDLAGEDLAERDVPTNAEKVIAAEIEEEDRKIAVGEDGVISIPAVACSTPRASTQKILFMRSFSGGTQLHHSRLGDRPEDAAFEYSFEVPEAGKYALTARVVTVNRNQHLLLRPNDAETPIDLAMPYTVGLWEETEPVEIALVRGKNVLHFTRDIPHCGLTIEHFTLTPVR
ncbi:MAG: hypothetical protein JXP34_28220 [Planctomycetes bacterium]|nr:hypothetical protein [Planctomycetota bacterium]